MCAQLKFITGTVLTVKNLADKTQQKYLIAFNSEILILCLDGKETR
jgi:hypothetical protein